MKVSLIAAIAQNGVIGKNNDLPWKLRSDMRFFVTSTKGHTVIMGRLNYESIGRPLPKRENIIVSHNAELLVSGCHTTTSVESALRMAEAAGEDEAFIIGGAQIYALALPYAHRFYRTRVLSNVDGDVFFPPLTESQWQVNSQSTHQKDEENEYAFEIELLTRREPPLSYAEKEE